MSHYGCDLAFIHDAGFGHFALGAGRALLGELRRVGLHEGMVVDLGCGSGITARVLGDGGYTVVGVDQSESLIQMARGRAPRANFSVGSYIDMAFPQCVAACAIGEVLNYKFDRRNDRTLRLRLFERVFGSLADGGVFLFDVAGPDRAPDQLARTFVEGEGWTVLVETDLEAGELRRRIVSYRRSGELYRRDSELHRLQLVVPGEIVSDLRSIGFEVKEIGHYEDVPLPRGLHGFIAHKPRQAEP